MKICNHRRICPAFYLLDLSCRDNGLGCGLYEVYNKMDYNGEEARRKILIESCKDARMQVEYGDIGLALRTRADPSGAFEL